LSPPLMRSRQVAVQMSGFAKLVRGLLGLGDGPGYLPDRRVPACYGQFRPSPTQSLRIWARTSASAKRQSRALIRLWSAHRAARRSAVGRAADFASVDVNDRDRPARRDPLSRKKAQNAAAAGAVGLTRQHRTRQHIRHARR